MPLPASCDACKLPPATLRYLARPRDLRRSLLRSCAISKPRCWPALEGWLCLRVFDDDGPGPDFPTLHQAVGLGKILARKCFSDFRDRPKQKIMSALSGGSANAGPSNNSPASVRVRCHLQMFLGGKATARHVVVNQIVDHRVIVHSPSRHLSQRLQHFRHKQ